MPLNKFAFWKICDILTMKERNIKFDRDKLFNHKQTYFKIRKGKYQMKKFILAIAIILMSTSLSYAEAFIPNYGYFENGNEINAKKEVMGNLDNIYDFEYSANAGGEAIKEGHYYVDVKYQGGYNGTDTDHVYLEDIMGQDGKDGKDGLNGVDGKDGIDGVKGDTGDKGDKGDRGRRGKRGYQGVKGNTGDTGAQGFQGEQGKGLEDRIEGIVDLRVLDTKHTTWDVYGGYDFNNDVSIVGAKCTIKIGKSYTDKKLEELEAKVANMTNTGDKSEKPEDVTLENWGQTGLQIHKKF